jgi:hypothetical protein
MRKICLLLLTTSFAAIVNGQTLANYTFSSSTSASLTDMTSGTTNFGNLTPGSYYDDVASSITNLPFPFFFMGSAYSQFSVNSNGQLRFGSTLISGGAVTTPAVGVAILAPMAGDNSIAATGRVHYKVTGLPGSQVMTVAWDSLQIPFNSTAGILAGTAQARLYEGTGIIEFVYGRVYNNSASASSRSIFLGSSNTATTNGYVTVGAVPTFTLSATNTTNSFAASSYVANLSNNTDGSRVMYTFTPGQTPPSDPITMTFTSVTLTGMTVNWVDNSTDEVNFALFRSTDGGSTYTLAGNIVSTTTAGTGTAYNSVQTGLTPGVTYTWKVVANKEGVASTPGLTGSQATSSCSIAGGTYTVGPTGTYTTLTAALAAINANGITGPVILELQAAYTSTTETFPITLNALPCVGALNTLTIRPETGATALTITSSNTTATIDFNGGNYIFIDGRPGGSGSVSQLTIANTATGTTGGTIRFINDAHHNTVTYCTITGVATSTTAGNILFSTTTGTLGNSDNTISNNTIRDGATTPTNGVYGSGTSGFANMNNIITNNNIFNFYNSTSTSNGGVGVNIAANNSGWTISNNSFYQTATRTTFGSGSTFNGILINSSTVNGTTISGNFIGGTAPNCGGTAMTLSTTATLVFRGIQMSVGTTTATSVQNNTIQNIAITTASTSTAQSLISAVTGNINIGNVTGNTLGSQSVTGSVTFVQSTTSTSPFFCGIIAGTGSPGVINISNNTIGGIAVSNSSTGTINVRGISFQGAATSYTVSGNTIGSTTTANSITNATNNFLAGIVGNSSSSSITISNNTIVNLTHNSTGTSAQLVGIAAPGSSGGAFNVTGNTVRNLTSGAANVGTNASASVIGISLTAATTAGQTVSQNTIHTLSNTNAGALNLTVTGLHYAGPTTGTNLVARNFVHSLSMSSTGTAPLMYGINAQAGLTNYQNNMVAIGNAVSANIGIFGMNDGLGTNNYYFNSVYVGGPGGFSGSLNTFAFNSGVTTNTRAFQDNIFVNARANAGSGRSYAVQVAGSAPNPTGLTINYNDYYVSGAGTVLGRFNSVDQSTISAWRTAVGQDANSISGNPQYLDPTNATPDLHIHPTNPTEIEGVGLVIGSVTDDFDGQTRASFTPTDLGADAGNFTAADLTGPSITYTLLGNTSCLTDVSLTPVTITDASNVNIAPGTRPRLYFKKSTNANTFNDNTNGTDGWKYVEATGVGGSPFSFTTNYSLLFGGGGVASGDVIQYFVVAEDLAATPNVGINAGTFAATPASVALTAAAFPIGGTVNSYSISTILPTTITVGASGDYPTLTGSGGLFAALNVGALNGNTTVNILDAAITETGLNSLNPLSFACGSGPYTLLIKPNTGVTTVLSGDVAGALINMNGADGVTFDGSNNGSTSKDMTIRNINTGGQTFRFINEATGDTIKNTIVEGANTSTVSGTILFSTVSSGTIGNSNNMIGNCDIRDRSDAAGVPANAVYSSGSAGGPNAANTVSGCQIFNFTNSGVLVSSTGAGDGWTINPTSFYQTASRTTGITVISIQGGSGHTITGNSIGGSASDRSSPAFTTTGIFTGISLAVGTTSPTSVQNNTISNINASGGSTQTFKGIVATAGNVNIGTITGNTIGGGAAAYDTIRTNYDADMIEYNSGTGTVNIENNTIGNIAYYNASGDRLFGIRGMSGTVTIRNNIVRDMKSNGSSTGFSFFPGGIWLATTTPGALVEGNQVYNIAHTNTGTAAYTIAGIYVSSVSSTGTATHIRKNKIYGITAVGTGTGTNAPRLWGIDIASGSATYSNNMISIGTGAGNEIRVMGIEDVGSGTNNHYFNSISITGSLSGGTNNSYAYNRSGTATVDIKDNVLSNTRTGGTGFHVAIANTNAAATNWAATASDYNDLYTSAPATLGQWLGSAASNNRDFTGWKASQGAGTPGSGGDANSWNIVPGFVNAATDLHIPAATSTPLESGGTPAGGITTDIDNETRPGPPGSINGGGTQVDIGADEFDGTPASPMTYVSSTTTQANTSNVSVGTSNQQVIGVQIVTTGALNPLSVTSFTLNTNGTTAPLTDIANAKLWYTGTSSTFATTTQFGATEPAPNGSFNITGTQVLAEGTNYFWLTYDVPCGATLANVVDAECNSLTVVSPQTPTVQAPAGSRTIIASTGLSGIKTIGAAGDYLSLTGTGGLFEAINTNGLSGNLTVNILDAAVTETGLVALNQITSVCGGPFTVLIKPNSGVNTVLSGTVSGALVKLNGADNVTIDGSNNGTSSQNMTIQNNSTATNTAAIWLASQGTGLGCMDNTIKNCIIKAGAIGSAANTFGIYVAGTSISTSGTGNDNDNLTIQNNSISKAYYGIYAVATSTGVNNNLSVTQNSIGSNTAADYVTFRGMVVTQADNATVSQNTVFNMITGEAVVLRAMEFGAGVTNTAISRNMIYNIQHTGTGFRAGQGISVNTTNPANITISNNVIYGLKGHGSGTMTNNSLGIALLGGGGYNIYYNSVNISDNRTATSSTDNHACMYIASAVTNVDMRNNVFAMTAVAGNAAGKTYGIYSLAANTAYTTINYNDFYAPGTTNRFAGFLTSDRTTLADIQAGFGQNLNSLVADPLFNSNVALIPQTGSPLVAAATPISITIDITGFTRSGVTPTIGAYEQSGDLVGPIISYSLIANTLCNTNRTLEATITDASGINNTPGTNPRLYFKKSTDANTYAGNTSGDNGWKYVEASNASSPFSFTTDYSLLQSPVTGGDIIQYFVVAQDLAGTPNVSVNSGTFAATPSSVALTAAAFPIGGTINSYNILTGGLSGTVTIGGAGTYPTLTGAGGLFAAINSSGLTGNLTVNILDATVTETGANALNAISYDCAGPYTILIKPGTGVTATLTGSIASNALIKLNGASGVTIDGSNNGTNSRDLTITNTSATSPTTVAITSTGTTPVSNNTLRNAIVINGVNSSSAVVISDGATLGNAGYFNNITIHNNSIQKAYVGVYTNAVTSGTNGSGLLLDSNELNTSGANAIRYIGLYVQGANGAIIRNNTISNFDATSNEDDKGIWIAAGSSNASVLRNKISNLGYSGTGGFGGHGIFVSTNTTGSNTLVANNFIAGMFGDGWDYTSIPTDNPIGIALSGTQTGVNVYNNSINLTGNTLNQTSAMSMGVYLGTGSTGDIRNNIIVNNLGLLAATGYGSVGVYAATANTQFTAINYNDYVVSATGSGVNYIGQIAAGGSATLAAWQTATGQDANSLNVVPVFVSATDLHLVPASNCTLHRKGTPIAGITTDIDGDARHAMYPDMGADEFTLPVTGTMTWNGSVSTDWFNVTNWTVCELPGPTSDVVIPMAVPNYPVVNGNVTIRTLNVNAGASITFGAGISFIILQ